MRQRLIPMWLHHRALVVIAWLLLSSRLSAAQTITVAVAANVQNAYTELAQQFEHDTGIVAQASVGATGKLSNQIRQGAPFHVFLAADSEQPKRLYDDGFALQAPKPYAIGSLVVWSRQERNLDAWQALLKSPQIQRIAIANPDTAPYGREARRSLQHFGLLPELEAKLVYGESIGQTNSFIATGAADIGITAKASVFRLSPELQGHWRELPANSYQRIIQSALLLNYASQHQPAAAEKFFRFLFSPAGQAILLRHGYLVP